MAPRLLQARREPAEQPPQGTSALLALLAPQFCECLLVLSLPCLQLGLEVHSLHLCAAQELRTGGHEVWLHSRGQWTASPRSGRPPTGGCCCRRPSIAHF